MQEIERIQCKKVAVVLLGYNSRDLLLKFVPSILKTDYEDFDLVYVDNASNDDSVHLVQTEFPKVKIFRIYENQGFTGGYTGSLPYIDAEYFVLLNSDVQVEPNWLSEQMKRMDADPKLGASQPKLLHYHDKERFDYAGASGGFIDKYAYPFCRGRIFDRVEKDRGQYNSIEDIFWASGAALLIRAELYHQLGGLDNDFYAHMEEIDLCWRVKNAGYRIEVVPSAVVYHMGGSVITYGSYEKIYHNFRNNLVMMYKNLPSNLVYKRLVVRAMLDLIAALQALLKARFTECKAILAAEFNFWTKLAKWKKNRNQAQSVVGNEKSVSAVYDKSIVYSFFVKGLKSFNQLKF